MYKLREYIIITASTIKDLQTYVNNHVQEGWTPIGGVAATIDATNNQDIFYQAMGFYEHI